MKNVKKIAAIASAAFCLSACGHMNEKYKNQEPPSLYMAQTQKQMKQKPKDEKKLNDVLKSILESKTINIYDAMDLTKKIKAPKKDFEEFSKILSGIKGKIECREIHSGIFSTIISEDEPEESVKEPIYAISMHYYPTENTITLNIMEELNLDGKTYGKGTQINFDEDGLKVILPEIKSR